MSYKKKIKVLRIIPTLDPSYGGPSTATIESSLVLHNRGMKVDIVTCDEKNKNFFKSSKIKIINYGPSFLGAYCFNIKLFLWLKKNNKNYDVFIVHGLWTFLTLMARLLIKKKYYLYLHGQLDPYFGKNIFKRLKKQIYWFFFERSNLLNAKLLLLTSAGEKYLLKKTFVNTEKIKKRIVQYGIKKKNYDNKKISTKFYKKFKKLKGKSFYLFLGRYDKKKGCDILVESVNKLKDKFNDLVLMCGPIRNSFFEEKIKKLIKIYKLEKKIIFSGPLYGELKYGAILRSKAMLLPSHGENFGVSLVESLSCGKPVITTNKVCISKDILRYRAGFISNNDFNSFYKAFNKFILLNERSVNQMSNNARKCFDSNFNLRSKKNSLFNLIKNDFSAKNKKNY
jgi:glycosyltransferase involved in cell wall biosynthesis